MVTESHRSITELIEPPLMAVDMRVPSMVVLRRLEQEGNHTAIITDEGKPIGLIQWCCRTARQWMTPSA